MKSLVYKLGYPVLKIYWFLFRPKTEGVKCLLKYQDEFLFIRHTYGKSAWSLPGGGINRGEDKESAVAREIKEELGIQIGNPIYLGNFVTTVEYKTDTVHCFEAEVKDKNFLMDKVELKDVEWFKENEIPNDRTSILGKLLKVRNLKLEGFNLIYGWFDKPNFEYQKHSHKDKVSFYVTHGSIDMFFEDKTVSLKKEDRIDVPIGVEHSAKVGEEGCFYIVGQMDKDDA